MLKGVSSFTCCTVKSFQCYVWEREKTQENVFCIVGYCTYVPALQMPSGSIRLPDNLKNKCNKVATLIQHLKFNIQHSFPFPSPPLRTKLRNNTKVDDKLNDLFLFYTLKLLFKTIWANTMTKLSIRIITNIRF